MSTKKYCIMTTIRKINNLATGKKGLLLSLSVSLALALTSCSELKDDSHYGSSHTNITNEELKIVSESSEQYLRSRSDLSSMTSLLAQEGVFDEINSKKQLSTLLVVTNDNFVMPDDKVSFVTRSHVSDVSISPANLTDGTRLMMWHGKYVNVTIDDLGKEGNIIDHICFNNGAVKEVVKTSSGYIYVISEMIKTPTSLYDYINELGDDYSLFKQMVLEAGTREFDRENSKAIGINEQGNTVYDSVFIYRNTFFESVGFDMNSESLTATMLVFSDEVMEEALKDAHDRLERWQMERSDSIMRKWVLKTSFFDKEFSAAQLSTTATEDLTSIFSTQWRPSAHVVDVDNPIKLSNGVVYNVRKLHMPNNVLMYRLKDVFYYYENCTAEEKEKYFKGINLNFKSCDTEVSAWTPWQGVWPLHENRVLRYDKPATVDDSEGFQLDFTPIKLNADGSVTPWLIPPGTYRLAMGSVQAQNLDVVVTILIDGVQVAQSPVITWGSSTAYHYDRGTTLPNRHPEGYDAAYVREMSGNSKADNYDTDGGLMIDELTIPDVKGDGSAVSVVLRITCNNWAGKTNVKLNHWCLRPTKNNY